MDGALRDEPWRRVLMCEALGEQMEPGAGRAVRRAENVPARAEAHPTGGSDLHDAGGGEGDDLPAQLLVHGLGELEVLLVDALEEDDPLR